MAKPVSLAAIEAKCREFGLTDIRYTPGATTADRPGTFDPIAITDHITAGGLGNRSEESYIRDIINGDPGVPLKANAVIAPDGTLWLNAAGNSNHCLYYSSKARQAALGQSFPLGGSVNYRGGMTKWSLYSYGVEVIAASKMNRHQYAVMIIWNAAIASLHRWSGQQVHGHGEVAKDRGFGDPNENMGQVRRDTMSVVSGSLRFKQDKLVPAGGITPDIPQEGEMAQTDIDTIHEKLDIIIGRTPGNLPQATDRIDKATAAAVEALGTLVARVGSGDSARNTWTYEAVKDIMIPILRELASESDVDSAKLNDIIAKLDELGEPEIPPIPEPPAPQ